MSVLNLNAVTIAASSTPSNRIIAGSNDTAPITDVFGAHYLNLQATSNVGMQFSRHSADTGGPVFAFYKSRGAAIGTATAASAGDYCGTIAWIAVDTSSGATAFPVAQLRAEVDHITSNKASGRFVWQTRDTTGSGVDRMVLDDTGAVSMGNTNTNAAVTAILDITSTTRGFLAPRMTTTQRDAITSPATGLQLYNTTTNQLNVYTGSAWYAVDDTSKQGDQYLLNQVFG